MTSSMVNLTARVPLEYIERLDVLAQQANQSRSEYLRDLVDRHIEGEDDLASGHQFGVEFFTIRQELGVVKQALGQVLVAVLMNLPDESGNGLNEAEARDLVATLLSARGGGGR